ncbi:predicted protein [Naegleria gruberi]|uniref:Predicted protein n=1 Tax=Naegleria gruberi TaxID=5762 RepID=D2V7K9_NAEGR|nr:uncharacterized protein NAEGRDRAFT_64840 [Naegleria gruberi]EFC47398.1 predicted protein [Naegleria gruberi]|eukprot:XP_002680142.1 predicted protein [Naegleria gruberi strain NEG-M]
MQKRTTPAGTIVDCPTSIEVTMITVTANILRQTLFGLSINIINNSTFYETNLWAMAYQPRLAPLYFELFTDIDFNTTESSTSTSLTMNNTSNNDNNTNNNSRGIRGIAEDSSTVNVEAGEVRRIALVGQQLVINSTTNIGMNDGIIINEPQMKNPLTDYVYIKPVRIRKAFFGTEFTVQAKLEDLLRSALEHPMDEGDRVESVPTLSELLVSNLGTQFEFKVYASKNSQVQFPLPTNVIFGDSNVFFEDTVSLNSDLEDPTLTMQRRVVSANYAISTLVVVVNGITGLIILFFLIYFRKTEPRASRGYLPYLVLFQVVINFCRVLLQSFWGEEYLLMIFTFITFGLLSGSYLIYFMNTLFFFYKRKVYAEMYNKLKRESFERKNQSSGSSSLAQLNNSPSSSGSNDKPIGERKGSDASSLNTSEKAKQLTFRWARSKKVKIFTVTFMAIVLIIIYSIIIPLLFTVPAPNVLIAIQAIGGLLVAFAVFLVIVAFSIDIVANKKLILGCKLKAYFVRNDRLYYRLEMLVHIISIVFYVSMGVVRSIAMSRTDDMVVLLSNTYAPSVILATFVALPLELIAIFLELMASGGGFICLMTLYERIRLSNQCAEGIGFLFDRYADHNDDNLKETSIELDAGEIIKFRTIRNSPYLDLLGDELARLFIDEKGFELIRQYAKTEFSIENLAFISDMEKVYTQLFMAVARPRSITGKSPSSDRPFYRPLLKQNLTEEEIAKATTELRENIYNTYIPDNAPMTVNLSSFSKTIFNKWAAKDFFTDDYLKSEYFVNDLDIVISEVVKNLRDTFRRLQLTAEYKEWFEIVKKNSVSLQAIQKAKALTKSSNSNLATIPPSTTLNGHGHINGHTVQPSQTPTTPTPLHNTSPGGTPIIVVTPAADNDKDTELNTIPTTNNSNITTTQPLHYQQHWFFPEHSNT